VGHPYAVSSPSLALAEARLETGADQVEEFVARVRQERTELTALLREHGADCPPSQANFVFGGFRDAGWVRDGLAGLGIGVRIFPGKPMLEGRLRITLPGDETDFTRLRRGLETLLAPEAFLVTAGVATSDPEGLESLGRALPIRQIPGADAAEVPGALDALGHERAWLVGDRPREMGWARARGLVPIGLATEPDGPSGREMIEAGAGRVVRRLSEIQELTP
jgi:hypothetical protein